MRRGVCSAHISYARQRELKAEMFVSLSTARPDRHDPPQVASSHDAASNGNGSRARRGSILSEGTHDVRRRRAGHGGVGIRGSGAGREADDRSRLRRVSVN